MISPSVSNVDLTTSYFDPLFLLIKQIETDTSDGDDHLPFPFDDTNPPTPISKNDDILDLASSLDLDRSLPAIRADSQTIHQDTEFDSLLAERDVLFGRGPGSSQSQGNKAFREFISNHKEVYGQTSDVHMKRLIAEEVYKEWKSIGGRFLKQYGNEWIEAEKMETIKKIRMTLRQKVKRIKSSCNEQKDKLLNKNAMAIIAETQAIYQNTARDSRVAQRDVLFGRGHGSSQFQGNKAFRGFIRMHKELYGKSDVKTKRFIVEESYKAWKSIGGRFLKQDGVEWVEAEEKKVINKISMTLRQKEKHIKEPSCNEQEEILRNKNIMDIIAEAVTAFELACCLA